MSRREKSLFVIGAIITVLLLLGAWWRGRDYEIIRRLDYRTHSYMIMRSELVESNEILSLVKSGITNKGFRLIEEHQPQASVWEIIGQSNRLWLFSTHLNKMTVIDAVARTKGDSAAVQRGYIVFEGFHTSGSKAFLMICFLAMLIAATFMVRIEMLPDIEPRSRE